MEIIGAKIILTIDEPWDSYRVIEGRIAQSIAKEDDSYLLVTELHSSENFIVFTRYKGDNFNSIVSGKEVIVDIAVSSKNDVSSIYRRKFPTSLKYIGIGSIKLFEDVEE